jgi:hypothetical protein
MAMSEHIIGELEIAVGKARQTLAGAENAQANGRAAYPDLTNMEYAEKTRHNTSSREHARAVYALEAREFLLTVARNWQPGDNAVDLADAEDEDAFGKVQ